MTVLWLIFIRKTGLFPDGTQGLPICIFFTKEACTGWLPALSANFWQSAQNRLFSWTPEPSGLLPDMKFIRVFQMRMLWAVTLNGIADSYIQEALNTYNANCFKATAVMVGCAAESLTLELRDELIAKMKTLGMNIPKKLEDWRIRTVLNALQNNFETKKQTMGKQLRESFEAYWPAFTQQIRAVRNEAGHPISVDPVTDRAVHSSLLIFPELAVLSSNMIRWIKNTYK